MLIKKSYVENLEKRNSDLQGKISFLQEEMEKSQQVLDQLIEKYSRDELNTKPIWKLFCEFLLSYGRICSDQFQVKEIEDNGNYHISFFLRNGQINSYNKKRGGTGMYSSWCKYRNIPENFFDLNCQESDFSISTKEELISSEESEN